MRPGVRIGVDVGDVRVGVAVSDRDGILATPVRTVARDLEGGTDREEVAAIVAETGAIEVVVGLPRSLSGEEGPAADRVRQYALALAEGIAPVTVRLVDERLTTVDAHRALRDSGLKGREHRAVVDQAAAVLILQTALDQERASGHPPGQPVGRRKQRTKDRKR